MSAVHLVVCWPPAGPVGATTTTKISPDPAIRGAGSGGGIASTLETGHGQTVVKVRDAVLSREELLSVGGRECE